MFDACVERENLEQDRLTFQLHGGVSGLISPHQENKLAKDLFRLVDLLVGMYFLKCSNRTCWWFIYAIGVCPNFCFSYTVRVQLLLSITGMRTISEPMIVAVSATAKMFVGDIVETGTHILCNSKMMLTCNFQITGDPLWQCSGGGGPSNGLWGALLPKSFANFHLKSTYLQGCYFQYFSL